MSCNHDSLDDLTVKDANILPLYKQYYTSQQKQQNIQKLVW